MTVYPFDDDAQSLTYPDSTVLKLVLTITERPNGDGSTSNAVVADFPDHMTSAQIIEACAQGAEVLRHVSEAHLRVHIEAATERLGDPDADTETIGHIALQAIQDVLADLAAVARCHVRARARVSGSPSTTRTLQRLGPDRLGRARRGRVLLRNR